jgi:hypothetical protein
MVQPQAQSWRMEANQARMESQHVNRSKIRVKLMLGTIPILPFSFGIGRSQERVRTRELEIRAENPE